MIILEFAPYVNGDLYTRECKAPARCTQHLYEKVVAAAAASEECKKIVSLTNSYMDFMYMMPDVANLFPLTEREEMFYCLKNGGFCPDVPAKCICVLKELYAQTGSVSLALKSLPSNMFKVFFQKNYLNNCTMRDVIKSFIDPDYEPFTTSMLRLKHKDYDEVYVLQTDMVAFLPKKLSAVIADTDIHKIVMGENGLEIDGLLLRQLGGYYGACNSNYDLRALV